MWYSFVEVIDFLFVEPCDGYDVIAASMFSNSRIPN